MKNRRLPPFLFSFLSKQIHKYEKKIVEKSGRLHNVYSKEGGLCPRITVELGIRGHTLPRTLSFKKEKKYNKQYHDCLDSTLF